MTAYDAAFARLAEAAGIDVLLVGDSLGPNVLGLAETTPVTLDDVIRHAAATVRATARAHVVGDLPFGTYEAADADAVRSAIALVKHGGVQSVKLEGGRRAAARIRAIADAGIPVVAHLGVLPQTAGLDAGFRRVRDREALLADAHAVEAAGAFAVVLEVVGDALAEEVTAALAIPTIGIGSGPGTDGQVLVMHDALGLTPEPPPFARAFADLARAAEDGFRAYAEAVREGAYPPRRDEPENG